MLGSLIENFKASFRTPPSPVQNTLSPQAKIPPLKDVPIHTPNCTQILIDSGKKELIAKNFVAARAYFELALEKDDQNPTVRLLLTHLERKQMSA